METIVYKTLREIYVNYGDGVVFEPKRLRAYLLDLRVPKKDANLLTDIAGIDYFKQFAAEIQEDETARDRLLYAVEKEHAFDADAVRAGVCCWAFAFTEKIENIIFADDGKEIWSEEKAELVAAALRELMK